MHHALPMIMRKMCISSFVLFRHKYNEPVVLYSPYEVKNACKNVMDPAQKAVLYWKCPIHSENQFHAKYLGSRKVSFIERASFA